MFKFKLGEHGFDSACSWCLQYRHMAPHNKFLWVGFWWAFLIDLSAKCSVIFLGFSLITNTFPRNSHVYLAYDLYELSSFFRILLERKLFCKSKNIFLAQFSVSTLPFKKETGGPENLSVMASHLYLSPFNKPNLSSTKYRAQYWGCRCMQGGKNLTVAWQPDCQG